MKRPTRLLLLLFFLATILAPSLALQNGQLVAQSESATPLIEATPLTVATPEGITPDQVNVIARELWCPLCNGVRLDACELKACAQMRDLIAIKLGEGESSESIQQYFFDAYGPQVLGRPPFEGFNWLAWILPPLVLLAGGALVWLRVRAMVRPEMAQGDVTTAPTVQQTDHHADEYAVKLDQELKARE